MDKRILTLKEAARYLGKTEKALYKAIERREIPFRRWGKKLVFDKLVLDRFIEALPGVGIEEALGRKFHG